MAMVDRTRGQATYLGRPAAGLTNGRPCSVTGSRRATGLPRRVTTTVSPAATAASTAARWRRNSRWLTVRIQRGYARDGPVRQALGGDERGPVYLRKGGGGGQVSC